MARLAKRVEAKNESESDPVGSLRWSTVGDGGGVSLVRDWGVLLLPVVEAGWTARRVKMKQELKDSEGKPPGGRLRTRHRWQSGRRLSAGGAGGGGRAGSGAAQEKTIWPLTD